ncbi:BTB/POZ domain-containing protein 3 [Cyberlindnera fabianii]|uniref:BTB/POZ domain-containing protein 3 n=1 Tax=Cyberlindnera fabianii TaxID=36022 RepID=A0A1V2L895_CYBFA|nr:BTB/POZ domain-containing protein 3 [Cyberlindnera fabianii]
MDTGFEQLCMACRLGDLESADKLISTGVNMLTNSNSQVNAVDEFDYTPLYLASLCGHEPVVKLLLQRGAVCDTDKYEGARCIYGALTDSIRNLLISYSISKAVDTNLPFAAHIRSLKEGSDIISEDIVVKMGNSLKEDEDHHLSFRLHRFMLSARSKYFRDKLQRQWKDKSEVELPFSDITDLKTLSVGLEYLYLVHDPKKFDDVDKESLLEFARKIELGALVDGLERYIVTDQPTEQAKILNEIQMKVFEEARTDFKNLVEEHIIGGKLTTFENKSISEAEVRELQESELFPDIILVVQEKMEIDVLPGEPAVPEDKLPLITTYYPVHRSILIRDEYFKVMFSSDFAEAHDYTIIPDLNIVDRSHPIPVINLPVPSWEIAEIVIKFLYYDHADIPMEHAVDTLYAGEVLMNDRLKTMAAVTLTSSKSPPPGYDLYDILRAAWETRMDRLEHHVARVIAENLDKFLNDPDFASIVLESSGRIRVRQETDTIELIDDIRFYLAKKWKIDFDGLFPNEKNDIVDQLPGYESYQEDLDKIESLLVELDLDA